MPYKEAKCFLNTILSLLVKIPPLHHTDNLLFAKF